MREALVVQPALLSVLHLSPLMSPSHFPMGLAFGWMRDRTVSYYPGVALHALWNAHIVLDRPDRLLALL